MPAIMRRDTCLDIIAQHSHPVSVNEVIMHRTVLHVTRMLTVSVSIRLKIDYT